MNKVKPQVILDTSFLIGIAEQPFNVSAEIDRIFPQGVQCYTVPSVISEIQRLQGRNNKDRRKRLFALKLLEALNVETLPADQFTTTKADDQIIEAATLLSSPIIATMDKELKRSLNQRGIPILSIRERSHLIVVGYVER